MSDTGYGFLDRLLHRLALDFESIAEFSFTLDQQAFQGSGVEVASQRHVFVSGLARSGTTVLMRRFHATGRYRSLTYRDMPFVLAPNLWRRLSSLSRRELKRAERVHGDRLLVDADSPESLDEVFWRVFAGREYLGESYLKPHTPAQDTIDQYVRYIDAVLSADSPRRERYLCKNNNNILRLGAIARAFPNALILIPFRDPVQHALSLKRQHARFSGLQKMDPFTLSYMTWLGHHEFGLDHRPVRIDGTAPTEPHTLDYWLKLWCDTYEWLEASRPASALFICYEDLCTTDSYWRRLAAWADIPADVDAGAQFKLLKREQDVIVDSTLAERALTIYERLRKAAREALLLPPIGTSCSGCSESARS